MAKDKRPASDGEKHPPNGPDHGPTPHGRRGFAGPFGHGAQMPFGMPGYGMFAGMMPPMMQPGMPPFGMPSPGFMPTPYGFLPMDAMMHHLAGRADYWQQFLAHMAHVAQEASKACGMLGQQAAGDSHGDTPIDMDALKRALEPMEPEQRDRVFYAVEMMERLASMRRGPTPPGSGKDDW